MPNWVRCELTLTCDTPERLDVAAAAVRHENDALSFQKITPMPEAEQENWYNWRIQHWGTKWDAGEATCDRVDENTLVYTFDTAWSPPEPVVAALSEQHPDVHVKLWFEEEQGWGGVLEGSGGDLQPTDEWDIPSSHSEIEARSRGECWCFSVDEQVFPDCFATRAAQALPAGSQELETATRLANDGWEEGFDRLLEVARNL